MTSAALKPVLPASSVIRAKSGGGARRVAAMKEAMETASKTLNFAKTTPDELKQVKNCG